MSNNNRKTQKKLILKERQINFKESYSELKRESVTSVFVSSRMDELREDRATAQKGICQAGCRPLMFEIEPSWDDLKNELDNIMERSDAFVGLYFTTAGHRGENIHMFTPVEYELYYFATRKIFKLAPELAKLPENGNDDSTKDSDVDEQIKKKKICFGNLKKIIDIIGAGGDSCIKNGRPHSLLSTEERGRVHSWRRSLTDAIEWLQKNDIEVFIKLRKAVRLFRRRSSNEWAGSVRLHQFLSFWEINGFVKIYDTQQELYCSVLREMKEINYTNLSEWYENQKGVSNIAKFTIKEDKETRGIIWSVAEILFQAGANIISAYSDKQKLNFYLELYDDHVDRERFSSKISNIINENKKELVIEKVADFLGCEAESKELEKRIGKALENANPKRVDETVDQLQTNCEKRLRDREQWQCNDNDIILVAYHRNVPGVLQAMTRTIATHRWTVKNIVMFPNWWGRGFSDGIFRDLTNIRSNYTQTTILRLSRLKNSEKSVESKEKQDLEILGAELEFSLVDLTGIERVLIFHHKID